MKEALRLAMRGQGRTSPNPMVGAVVVQGDVVVGKGYHERVGGPHAEVNALREAGEKAKGATLYVTLEPCNHHGRTPPCTLSVLAAKISRVVVGMSDPNPRVEGGGADFLRNHGVRVDSGVLEKECRSINQAFIKHVTKGIPFVMLKTAATLDGRIATRTGDARWISNEKSRRYVHRLRCSLDGILVGIGTVLQDDPLLTARVPGRNAACRQPVRVVLDSCLKLPLGCQLVRTAKEVPLWVACSDGAPRQNEAQLTEAGALVLRLPGGDSRVELQTLLAELGKRQVTSLLVEGGARVIGSFLDNGLVDEALFFFAPKILGDSEGVPMASGAPRMEMAEALQVYDVRVKRFDEDVMLHVRLNEQPF